MSSLREVVELKTEKKTENVWNHSLITLRDCSTKKMTNMEFCEKFNLQVFDQNKAKFSRQAEKMLAYYGFANNVEIDYMLVFKKATNF